MMLEEGPNNNLSQNITDRERIAGTGHTPKEVPSQRRFEPVLRMTASEKSYNRIARHGDIRMHYLGLAHWRYMETSQRKVRNSVRAGPP